MAIEVRPCRSVEELSAAQGAVGHYIGLQGSLEGSERFAQWLDLERMHAAWDGDRIVGGAGAFAWGLSVPGGEVAAAGTTVVGVLPTHRRRGILTQLMRAHIDDAHERDEPVAYLWASEGTIYGRFGYGLASRVGQVTLPRERVAFAVPFEPRGLVRLVDVEESVRAFPPLYDAVFAQRPGLNRRSAVWWETRRLVNSPFAQGAAPLNRALLSLDGKPAGYALYKVEQSWEGGSSTGKLTVLEAVAPTPEGTRELWRWLLDFDWTSQIVADLLPLDHELHLLLAEPRRMRFELNDGLWVRLVDVGTALSARSYRGDGAVVFEVRDAFCPWNEGRWRVSARGAERVDAEAEIELDVTSLGSVYLGGFTFAELERAMRLAERVPGAVERADEFFATSVEPWCPEIF
jgi:predicted acetyltransferase